MRPHAALPNHHRSSRRALRPFAAATLLLLAAGCHRKETGEGGHPVAAPNTAKYADAIAPMLSAAELPFLRWPKVADYQPMLSSFYNNRQLELAWSRDGKPTSQASALIDAFTHADAKGLRPEDYDGLRWPERVRGLASGDHQAVAQFDVALTVDTMRLLSDLHMGRVAPQHFNFEIDAQSKRIDLPKFLNDRLLEASDVPGVIASVEPDSDDYRRTLDALHRYQELARAQTQAEPLPDPGKNLAVGEHYGALPALEARLALEGDGPSPATDANAAAGGSTTLSPADADAIKVYQARHGIMPDGKLGPVTVKSLNVPMTARVTQLEDALERWRWLPGPYDKPRLLVNLPEFVLRGYSESHEQEFAMRVVVGKVNGDHETPVFAHMMKYLIFRPYWNVPVSIIKKELVPHMLAKPGYLEAKNYEVLDRSGKPTADYTTEGVAHARYLIREKPGPGNSLGLVKFMFPNQFDIYLHSTPEVSLFSRARRDFSHGCVRVQHPDELAVWVLRGQSTKDGGDWDLNAVQAAMNGDEDNRQVNLKTQLPIVIFYLTAHVEGDGKVSFFDDIYHYDAELEDVLQQGPPYPTKPTPVKPKTQPGDTV